MTKNDQKVDFLVLFKEINQQMIKASTDDFDPLLESKLNIIRNDLNLSSIHLFLLDASSNQFICTYESKNPNDQKENDLKIQQLKLDQTVFQKHILSIERIQEEHPLRPFFNLRLNQECLLIPIQIEKQLFGFIKIDVQKEELALNKQHMDALNQFAAILSLQYHLKMLLSEHHEHVNQEMELSKTKDRFISNMSHEIRTPLSGIYNAFYLLETTKISKEQQSYIDLGKTSLEVISNRFNDLIDYSSLQKDVTQINKDVFDLEDELTQLVRTFKNVNHHKDLEIKLEVDQNIHYKLIGDYQKIKQIIINIFDNAIKYTQKGVIKLNATCISLMDHQVKIIIQIQDTGLGMDESELEQIMTPLKQIDDKDTKKYQGLGLGFSIAKQYADLIGATISIQSQKYQGTQVTIALDLIKGEDITYPELEQVKVFFANRLDKESLTAHLFTQMNAVCFDLKNHSNLIADIIVFEENGIDQSEIDRLRRQYGHEKTMILLIKETTQFKSIHIDQSLVFPISKQDILKTFKLHLKQFTKHEYDKAYNELLSGHVMIVDDNRLNRLALESVLSKLGMRITTVDSGSKAIEKVQRDNYDIIFMDVQMPIMDGIEATRKIRHLGKKYEDIPIIAVTANAYFKDYDLLKSAKINDVIFKPIQMDQLNSILRKHLNRKSKIKVPLELLVFDEIDFNMRFEGALDIAEEVIATFLTEYQKDLIKIHDSIQLQNPQEIIENAHYFKGSCSYLSAKKAVWVLDLILNEAKQMKLDQMELLYARLVEFVDEVVLTLNKKSNL
jgi:signal transduction histidine kinase/CheY-like chemotaxis protein/HPt (histidine-containing phosphotransfer) domain-containing protein